MSTEDRQKQIDIIARSFSMQSHAGDPRSFSEGIELGFKAGAAWADRNPANKWHDASEMPKEGEWTLIQFGEDSYDTLVLSDFGADIFRAWCKKCGVIRWAQINDLLPKGGEK